MYLHFTKLINPAGRYMQIHDLYFKKHCNPTERTHVPNMEMPTPHFTDRICSEKTVHKVKIHREKSAPT
jgi:hypothetical protein